MNSDRRGFFKRLFGLGAAVVAAKVVPEVLTPNITAAASHSVQTIGYCHAMPFNTYTTSGGMGNVIYFTSANATATHSFTFSKGEVS